MAVPPTLSSVFMAHSFTISPVRARCVNEDLLPNERAGPWTVGGSPGPIIGGTRLLFVSRCGEGKAFLLLCMFEVFHHKQTVYCFHCYAVSFSHIHTASCSQKQHLTVPAF